MEGLKIIDENYQFKSRNMLNEKVSINVHFQEYLIKFPTITRFVLYCTIFVRTARGKLQFYHGGTVWNGEDTFDRNDAIFKAFQDAMVRRFAKECCESEIDSDNYERDWEKYRKGWCEYLWTVMNGATNGNHPNFF